MILFSVWCQYMPLVHRVIHRFHFSCLYRAEDREVKHKNTCASKCTTVARGRHTRTSHTHPCVSNTMKINGKETSQACEVILAHENDVFIQLSSSIDASVCTNIGTCNSFAAIFVMITNQMAFEWWTNERTLTFDDISVRVGDDSCNEKWNES